MADFVAVLKKTIDGLGDNTPELRQKVYEKARATIAAKIAAINPPPSALVVERQNKALEDAIAVVEASYVAPAGAPDDDFDEILASLESPAPAARHVAPPVAAPSAAAPASERQGAFGESRAPREEPPPEPASWSPASAAFDPAAAENPPQPFDADAGADADIADGPEPLPEPAGDAGRDHSFRAGPGDPAVELSPVAPAPRGQPELAGSASRKRRGLPMGAVVTVVLLLVMAGAAYGVWLNRDEFADLLGMSDRQVAATTDPQAPDEATPAPTEAEPTDAAPQPSGTPANAGGDPLQKFTQRLTESGEETDPGPAGGERTIGEGTSVAAATQPSEPATAAQPAAPEQSPAAQPGAQEGIPVGQRAIFYEERTTATTGTAEQGSIVWSTIQESPGGDLPPERAIRAEVRIPAKDLQMRMTIRRNGDASLPASHIVEMIFLTPESFPGGEISNVLRIAFKPSEEAPGRALLGIPVKIAEGYFLIALSDQPNDIAVNEQLLEQQSWIDIPIVYTSGRRALVSIEKGVPGARIFEEALRSWRQSAADAG